MVSELSILIPVFNQKVGVLTEKLLQQCKELTSRFEICIYDDGSDEVIRREHRYLFQMPEVRYVELRHNIGRAAIRNLLAREANFAHLLFLDNDSALPDDQFVKRYWESAKNCDVVIGGTIYQNEKPSDVFMLRWRYGKEREEKLAIQRNLEPYKSLTLNNMLIKRSVYLTHPLDVEISGYGHEDTKFGWELKKYGVNVCHIDNPVIHLGLETAPEFLNKTSQAVKNLFKLYKKEGKIPDSKLIASYQKLKTARMGKPYQMVFRVFQESVLANLRSPEPNITYLDMYKLYLFLEEANPIKQATSKK